MDGQQCETMAVNEGWPSYLCPIANLGSYREGITRYPIQCSLHQRSRLPKVSISLEFCS
jgi:hypothetical protein